MSAFRNRNDTAILVLSVAAVLTASLISLATTSIRDQAERIGELENPYGKAEAAAKAGLESAKWHIQCHGRTKRGSIASQYYINGAVYSAEWDDVNLSDSMVTVRSRGEFTQTENQTFIINLDSQIKISLIPVHNQEILNDYYSQARPSVNAIAAEKNESSPNAQTLTANSR